MGKVFKFAESELQHSGTSTKPKYMFIEVLPEQDGTLTYNGEDQYPTWKNLDPLKLIVEGEKSAINAGIHYITVTPFGNFGWPDNSQTPRQIPYEIKRKPIDVQPSLQSSLTFNGLEQTPTWNNFNPDIMSIGGTFENQINVGTYDATFTPDTNHCWRDGSFNPITMPWSIEKWLFDKVTASQIAYTYTGNNISLAVNNFNADWMSKSGDWQATAKGTYQATFSLNDKLNTAWKDNSTDDVNISWSVAALKLAKVTANATSIPYDAKNISPTWNNFNSTYIQSSGDTTGYDVGSYSTTFSLKDKINTTWSDGSTDDITINWSITKRKFAKVTASTLTYNDGNALYPTLNNYDERFMTEVGSYAYEVGEYTTTVRLDDKVNTQWSDGTTADLAVKWYVVQKPIDVVALNSALLEFDTSYQTPDFRDSDRDYADAYINLTVTPQRNVGTYTATLSLKDKKNTYWFRGGDGGYDIKDKTVEWKIEPFPIIEVAGWIRIERNVTYNVVDFFNPALGRPADLMPNITEFSPSTVKFTTTGNHTTTVKLLTKNYYILWPRNGNDYQTDLQLTIDA